MVAKLKGLLKVLLIVLLIVFFDLLFLIQAKDKLSLVF